MTLASLLHIYSETEINKCTRFNLTVCPSNEALARSLDHHHADVRCSNGHSLESRAPAGFYALKEAGAPFTILAFRCGHCHRELFVTEQVPYGPPSPAMLQEIDETP